MRKVRVGDEDKNEHRKKIQNSIQHNNSNNYSYPMHNIRHNMSTAIEIL